MAKKTGRTSKGGELTFTAAEVEALRAIAQDWIQSELVLPPYAAAMKSALAKLGVAPEEAARGRRAAVGKRSAAGKRARSVEATASGIEPVDPLRTPPLRVNLG